MDYAGTNRDRWQAASGLGAVLALHAVLIWGLLNGLDSVFTSHQPPPMLTRLLSDPPSPPPPPHFVPDLPAPSIFVPKLEIPAVPPPPNQPPAQVTHMPEPQRPFPPAAPPAAAADTSFSPSAIRGGAPAPAYPDEYEAAARAGRVSVACIIETTGIPTHCRVLSAAGGQAFAAETLRWLTSPGHPVYRPAIKAGQKQREDHQWVVEFGPPAGEGQ